MAVTFASYVGDVDGDGDDDDGEWEICNDDGFVYKRRRRLRPSAAADDDPRPPPPPPPGEAEAELRRRRRARRRLCLLGLRDKYRNELDQWESLASALLRLSSSAPTPSPSPLPPPPPPPPEAAEEAGARRLLVDDLLSQVEAQEAILRKLSEVCDYAESLCKKHEESVAESLIELPIWGSPHSLMASLSD